MGVSQVGDAESYCRDGVKVGSCSGGQKHLVYVLRMLGSVCFSGAPPGTPKQHTSSCKKTTGWYVDVGFWVTAGGRPCVLIADEMLSSLDGEPRQIPPPPSRCPPVPPHFGRRFTGQPRGCQQINHRCVGMYVRRRAAGPGGEPAGGAHPPVLAGRALQ